jgi:hypothetical protein
MYNNIQGDNMPSNRDDEMETEIQSSSNPHEIRDLIFTALSLTEYTKVPMLFLGNPGIAKTTGVRMWANLFGYKVTTLIGTQRVAEEILGYMVNDTQEKRLITYTPDWFDEIQENSKAGFKTLLFVDELSQAPDNVQGAMLQLIFDRRVGGRANYLPEDCVVVAAANYKGNIPPQCSIQAPTLNRFCIVNVQPTDGLSLLGEFLQSKEEMEANLPIFQDIPISEKIEETVRVTMRDYLTHLITTYCTKSNDGDGESSLDFQNTQFSEIFDQPGPIYNFLTGRTIHYMFRIAVGMIHLGIVRQSHKERIKNICLGLGGLGTNTFASEKNKEEFRISLCSAFQKTIRRSVESNSVEINSVELDYKNKTIEKCISDWMRYQESKGKINDVNLSRLLKEIDNVYGAETSKMANKLQNWDSNRVLSDLQKIETLTNYLKTAQISEIIPIIKRLDIIVNAWDSYKVAILHNLVK